MSDQAPRIGPGGFATLLVFFGIETAAGFALGALCYAPASAVTSAILPASERNFAGVCAVILCFVPACTTMWAIDQLCLGLSGHSLIDNMHYLP